MNSLTRSLSGETRVAVLSIGVLLTKKTYGMFHSRLCKQHVGLWGHRPGGFGLVSWPRALRGARETLLPRPSCLAWPRVAEGRESQVDKKPSRQPTSVTWPCLWKQRSGCAGPGLKSSWSLCTETCPRFSAWQGWWIQLGSAPACTSFERAIFFLRRHGWRREERIGFEPEETSFGPGVVPAALRELHKAAVGNDPQTPCSSLLVAVLLTWLPIWSTDCAPSCGLAGHLLGVPGGLHGGCGGEGKDKILNSFTCYGAVLWKRSCCWFGPGWAPAFW